jgi:2-C-methyl-D-erythritol 4-phosphate cytidylyltransferase
MDTIAIIVAAGAGTRKGSDLPKQFLLLAGKPIILYTIEAFIQAVPGIKIILVLPQNQLAYCKTLVQNQAYKDQLTFTAGGNTRFQSVSHGLALVPEGSLVAVHDGVRCLITPDLIKRSFAGAASKGSAIPVVPVSDSLRAIIPQKEGQTSHSIDRENIRMVQTPQSFKSTLLKKAFASPYQNSFTDEASVVEAMGQPVYLMEGDPKNIKITRPFDLIVAEAVLQQRATQRQ